MSKRAWVAAVIACALLVAVVGEVLVSLRFAAVTPTSTSVSGTPRALADGSSSEQCDQDLRAIDAALQDISTMRAVIGAQQNRLASEITRVQLAAESLLAGGSRIAPQQNPYSRLRGSGQQNQGVGVPDLPSLDSLLAVTYAELPAGVARDEMEVILQHSRGIVAIVPNDPMANFEAVLAELDEALGRAEIADSELDYRAHALGWYRDEAVRCVVSRS